MTWIPFLRTHPHGSCSMFLRFDGISAFPTVHMTQSCNWSQLSQSKRNGLAFCGFLMPALGRSVFLFSLPWFTPVHSTCAGHHAKLFHAAPCSLWVCLMWRCFQEGVFTVVALLFLLSCVPWLPMFFSFSFWLASCKWASPVFLRSSFHPTSPHRF